MHFIGMVLAAWCCLALTAMSIPIETPQRTFVKSFKHKLTRVTSNARAHRTPKLPVLSEFIIQSTKPEHLPMSYKSRESGRIYRCILVTAGMKFVLQVHSVEPMRTTGEPHLGPGDTGKAKQRLCVNVVPGMHATVNILSTNPMSVVMVSPMGRSAVKAPLKPRSQIDAVEA